MGHSLDYLSAVLSTAFLFVSALVFSAQYARDNYFPALQLPFPFERLTGSSNGTAKTFAGATGTQPDLTRWRWTRFGLAFLNLVLFWLQLIFVLRRNSDEDDTKRNPYALFGAFSGVAVWLYASTLSLSDALRHTRLMYHTDAHLNWLYVLTSAVHGARFLFPESASAPTGISTTEFLVELSLLMVWLTEPRAYVPLELMHPDSTPSPEQTASIFSIATYMWLDKLIAYGWSHTIGVEDVYTLPDYNFAHYWAGKFDDVAKTASLLFNVIHVLGFEFLDMLFFAMLWSLSNYIAPYSLNKVLDYIQDPKSFTVSPYIFVFGIFFGPIFETLFFQRSLWTNTKIIIRLRAILTSELFVKLLRTPESSSANPDDEEAKSRIGKINNMIQTDIGAFEDQLESLIFLGTTPLRFVICMYFLYQLVGWSCFLGLASVLITMPLPAWVSSQFGEIQERVMKATDKRLGLINELLQSIRMIKFFAWEDSMKSRVSDARVAEIREIRGRNFTYIYMALVWSLVPLIVMSITLFAYTNLMGRELTASVAFTVLSLFNILREVLGMLPWAVAGLMRAKVSYLRITKFLAEPELQPPYPGAELATIVGFDNASFQWFKPPSDNDTEANPTAPAVSSTTTYGSLTLDVSPTPQGTMTPTLGATTPTLGATTPQRVFMLRELDVKFPRGELSIVTGKTASGKTSLLMAMLGEMHRVAGRVWLPKLEGVAYCAQTAWLQNDTIKNNILFGSKFEEQRYRDVLFQCALLPDLAVLDAGDETEIGEKGITLSGGQKQRVALARAVYSNAQTVLLDDCLSAVDSHTAKHLVDHCLLGSLLKDRTRILVTHYVSLCASVASYVVVVDYGRIIGKGTPTEVLQKNEATRNLLLQDELSDLNATHKHGEAATAKAPGPDDGESIDSGETKVTKAGKLMTAEERSEGSVEWNVYKFYMIAFGGLRFWSLFFVLRFIGHMTEFGQYFWIQVWTRAYEDSHDIPLVSHFTSFTALVTPYLSFSPSAFATSHDSYLADTFSAPPPNNGTVNGPVDSVFYLGVYAAIGLISTSIFLGTFGLLIIGATRASMALHRELLDRICGAPIRWFDKVPMGRIVNRFAKDMAMIDAEVYETISSVSDNALEVLGILVIISMIMPWFMFPGIGITVLFYFVGRAYIRTNLALRRIVSISRSPIYTFFGDSVIGLVTIRAFAANNRFYDKILKLTDGLNRPEIFMWSMNRWLAVRNDFLSGVIVFVTGALVVSSGSIDPGVAGAVLTLALQFTHSMLWLVRNYNMNELNMNAVERVMEYIQISQEPAATEHGKAPAAWPTEGDIRVESLSVQYSVDTPLVLKDLSFEIRPREKIGVVGRTGSGKSTLALTLLRFVDITEGRIFINGIDISQINLADLRSRVTIIPQDPLLFSGSIRFNLDPFGEHDDAILWSALRHAHLIDGEVQAEASAAEIVVNENGNEEENANQNKNERVKITLDSHVSEGGSNFSQGERQLIALARALVRRSKVLILDEATSSVDRDTDDNIQTTIRNEFGEATLLTIAHRLRTVMDYTRILVLSEGQIAEFDTPYNLMEDKKSIFHSMCQKSGEYKELHKIAKESHERLQQ